MKTIIQKLINESRFIKDNFGNLKLGSFYLIEGIYNSSEKYFHKGIYELKFDLLTGIFLQNIALVLDKDDNLGYSQWLLNSDLLIRDISLRESSGNYIIHFRGSYLTFDMKEIAKEKIFDNTDFSWSFVVNTLNELKSKGVAVSYELYPYEYNNDYVFEKTCDFLKTNFDKIS